MSVEIRRGTDRYLTRGEGFFTRHSFSFGAHYDPDNVAFGPLVCHDDHRLKAGAGFSDHPHRDVEIVTWVLSGSLRHSDSAGHSGVVRPGEVEHMLWTVEGRPSLTITTERRDSAHATAGSFFNRIPDVIAAPPGIVTISEMGPLKHTALI